MATNKELLQEACDRVRLGKSLTNKMKVLLARAALEQVDEIEASVRVAAIDISEGMKNERRKKKLTKRREEKKVEARNMGVDKKLAGCLSAIALENAGKEKVMSLKALYLDVAGAHVLEETLAAGREMRVVIGGATTASADGGERKRA